MNLQYDSPKAEVRMRPALDAKTHDPLFDLLARVLDEEPVQIGTVAILQRPFND